METTIQTRNDAFYTIANKLPEKRKIVYYAMRKMGNCTAKDVAEKLGWKINSVVGRINELRDEHCLITDVCKRKDEHTGVQNTVYAVVPKSLVKYLMESKISVLLLKRDQLHEGFHAMENKVCKELIGLEIKKVEKKINSIKEIDI